MWHNAVAWARQVAGGEGQEDAHTASESSAWVVRRMEACLREPCSGAQASTAKSPSPPRAPCSLLTLQQNLSSPPHQVGYAPCPIHAHDWSVVEPTVFLRTLICTRTSPGPGGATVTVRTSSGFLASQAMAALHSMGLPIVDMSVQYAQPYVGYKLSERACLCCGRTNHLGYPESELVNLYMGV